jgi:NADPH:quinone reductase
VRVVQLRRFGGPEVLEIVETATPALEPAEVLIRVRAAGINFFEILMRQNRYATTPELPLPMGVEVYWSPRRQVASVRCSCSSPAAAGRTS